MADRKEKFALLSHFGKVYATKTGQKFSTNKYAAQWDADALIESYGIDECKQLVDRYVELSSSPSWKGFCRSAERVYNGMKEEEEDLANRTAMKRRVREWIAND